MANEQLRNLSLSTRTPKCLVNGTHRVVPVGATINRVQELRAPLGITRVANVTGLDCIGIPVVMVCRPNARSLSVSPGKGLSIEAARASGLMEATELYHAERISLPLRLCTWNEIRFSEPMVAVESLPRIGPSKFHSDLPLLWIEGHDFGSRNPRWLPFELVHTNFLLPLPSGSGCFVMGSNGLASGNHLLEALLHGLCEIIERDAASLFHHQSVERQEETRIDPDTIDDADCQSLLELYRKAGIGVAIWEITSDLGVSAFRVVIVERTPNPFRPMGPVKGMGCHPSRAIALSRALTEAAQGRLTLVAGARDELGPEGYRNFFDPERHRQALARLALPARRKFRDGESFDASYLEKDFSFLLERLCSAGYEEVVAVDISKPEFNIPVVRVVVPGLEAHFQVPGYVPGRRVRQAVQN